MKYRCVEPMRSIIIILFLILLSNELKSEEDIRLPYGATFGQKFDPMEHETIRRLGNIRSVRLRTTSRPDDTEELRAEICDEYGLQIITWRSHIRSLESASASHREIVRKFKKKIGLPSLKGGSLIWKANDYYIVVKIRQNNNVHQNQIRYFGPKNESCFDEFIKHQQQKEMEIGNPTEEGLLYQQ